MSDALEQLGFFTRRQKLRLVEKSRRPGARGE
jgi:hypothetical protein